MKAQFKSRINSNFKPIRNSIIPALVLGLGLLLISCESDDESNPNEGPAGNSSGNSLSPTDFRTNLDLPDSITGGQLGSANKSFHARAAGNVSDNMESAARGTGLPCIYLGPDEGLFDDGYQMTKFMVSSVATWSCIGDTLIVLSNLLPHDGVIKNTQHDAADADYDTSEPTHYAIDDSNTGKTSVKLYYGYEHSNPPTTDSYAGFYFSWTEENGTTNGRMLIDAIEIDKAEHNDDDPVSMRMDFTYTDTSKTADMYLNFDSNNLWADGFRIKVIKDLTTVEQVFTAQGLLDMTRQFVPAEGISDTPTIKLYSVSDTFGEGAAIAEFANLAFPLPVDSNNHLGNYQANKVDQYFFESDGDWDWVNKTFSSASLKGGRNLTTHTESDIESFLGLTDDYFGEECSTEGDDCVELFNIIFEDGFYGQAENQGSDPLDWRSDAIAAYEYLDSVYPEGFTSWEGVFDQTF